MKLKRILALAGVIILVGMYLSALILAVMGSSRSMNLFVLSLACTIAIPVMIHLFMMLNNARHGKNIMDETYSYREKKEDGDKANPPS